MQIINNHNLFNEITDAIAEQGFVVVDQAFNDDFIIGLQKQALKVSQYQSAGIGRGDQFHNNSKIRNDEIFWLNNQHVTHQGYFNWAEGLRLALNQQLYLGLFEYECMFAHYPKGAFYKKHLDAFKQSAQVNQRMRRVSTILYLNPQWLPTDGGELLLYHPGDERPFQRILPQMGKLVVFLSEQFPHEVLVANKSRYSLTGWFRVNN